MTDNHTSEQRHAKGSTVTRVLDILSQVAEAERPLTPTEIAEQLDVPRASVHRLCATLEAHGYLKTRLNGRGMLPGHRLNQMALGILSSTPLQAQRQAILKELSEDIGETCNIAVPDGVEMVCFDRVETHWPVRINVQIGTRAPVWCTASGKLYLSSLSPAMRDRILSDIRLRPYTSNTLLSVDELKKEVIATGERGYGLDNEEYIEGMVAMAVPIRDSSERFYATLSFHAPCMRLPFSAVSGYLPLLRAASKRLSALLDE